MLHLLLRYYCIVSTVISTRSPTCLFLTATFDAVHSVCRRDKSHETMLFLSVTRGCLAIGRLTFKYYLSVPVINMLLRQLCRLFALFLTERWKDRERETYVSCVPCTPILTDVAPFLPWLDGSKYMDCVFQPLVFSGLPPFTSKMDGLKRASGVAQNNAERKTHAL